MTEVCSNLEDAIFTSTGPNLAELDGTPVDLAVETVLTAIKAKKGSFKHRKQWRAHTEWTHALGCPTSTS
uniref:Ald_Xan_dh_C2 domain-containing protein n=1 Tax=Panagrellus redivivus TaxID=6233 RepID=A0A7E4VWK1_PANRE